MKILIVEDEYKLADAIADSLQSIHYDAEIAADGVTGAEKACSGLYDLCILDVMLPGKNGFEILEEIRRMQPEMKVIMLTAKGELEDKLRGLNNGADDYMTKPFHMEELAARVNLQLKRKNSEDHELLRFGNMALNRKNGTLENTETLESLPVSGKEFSLLEYFLEHPQQILSREQLYNKVWGWDNTIESNNLEAYLSFLRKKFRLLKGNITIKANRGLGYRLEEKGSGEK